MRTFKFDIITFMISFKAIDSTSLLEIYIIYTVNDVEHNVRVTNISP